MQKIIIIVKGGVVTGVWSSDKELDVDILDFDNEPGENFQDEDNKITEVTAGLVAVF